jgi:hypothetical protein
MHATPPLEDLLAVKFDLTLDLASESIDRLDRVMNRLGDDPPVTDEVGVGAIPYSGAVRLGRPLQERHLALHESSAIVERAVGQLALQLCGLGAQAVVAVPTPPLDRITAALS